MEFVTYTPLHAAVTSSWRCVCQLSNRTPTHTHSEKKYRNVFKHPGQLPFHSCSWCVLAKFLSNRCRLRCDGQFKITRNSTVIPQMWSRCEAKRVGAVKSATSTLVKGRNVYSSFGTPKEIYYRTCILLYKIHKKSLS